MNLNSSHWKPAVLFCILCPPLVASLGGCASPSVNAPFSSVSIKALPPTGTRGPDASKQVDRKALAEFYLPYAAMAAKVYDTKGRSDELLSKAASSSWLRDEIASSADLEERNARTDLLRDPTRREWLYKRRIGIRCTGARASFTLGADDSAVRAFEQRCRNSKDATTEDEPEVMPPDEDPAQQPLTTEAPTHWEQCEYKGSGAHPMVPVQEMTKGWSTVPELQRTLHPRGWSLFVPGLAIDVWRRHRGAEGEAPVVEYALVFRGTADGGGWISNFRALTAFTPLVWDQYRQARVATIDLVNQIYQLHSLSDALFERAADTRIKITAVGHSLGGGLASYVFLRIPQITRVVSFDPSPINGSSMFSPAQANDFERAAGRRDRASVLADRLQPLDRDPFDEKANLFVLYEDGEILTRLTGCVSGPIWGAEGGPVARCDGPDLSSGSIVRQHNMPQLACKLYLASQGLPTRAVEEEPR